MGNYLRVANEKYKIMLSNLHTKKKGECETLLYYSFLSGFREGILYEKEKGNLS